MATTEVLEERKLAIPKESVWRSLWHFALDKPLGAVGGIIFILMIILAIVAPFVAPQDPLTTNVPGRLAAPSWQHWMGTDEVGRDVLSRLIFGAQVSMLVGVASTVVGSTGGFIIGIVSGYLGGRVDMYTQRVMDMLMAFPILVLAIAIMAVLGNSVQNVIIAISIPNIPRMNRVVRSVAMSVKELTYIEAATAIGASTPRIIFRHVLPNTLASFLIVATSLLGGAVLVEASLSFLGLGVPPPHPSWGRSLSEAMPFYLQAPWLAIFPGIAISLAVFGANLLGDALRDIWDPRLKRL